MKNIVSEMLNLLNRFNSRRQDYTESGSTEYIQTEVQRKWKILKHIS